MEIVGDSDSQSSADVAAIGRPRRPGRLPCNQGSTCIFLLLTSSATGLWAKQADRRPGDLHSGLPGDRLSALLGGGTCIVGAAVGYWAFHDLATAPEDSWVCKSAMDPVRGIDMFGFIQYIAVASVCLEMFVPGIDPASLPLDIIARLHASRTTCGTTLR